MDNDLGKIHDTEDDAALQEAHQPLALELNAREVGTPEQLEALERRIAEQAATVSAWSALLISVNHFFNSE